jgi:hypothetical protein
MLSIAGDARMDPRLSEEIPGNVETGMHAT